MGKIFDGLKLLRHPEMTAIVVVVFKPSNNCAILCVYAVVSNLLTLEL
jgi:hypothetical protein